MLKWQPWHSRLHFPFFALGIVLLSYLVDIIPSIQKFVLRVLPLMMLLSLFVVLVNYTRPIISIPGVHKTAINDIRYRQFFSNKPELTAEYETIHTLMNASNNNTIGVELGTEDDWEYPLFCNTFERHWNVKHILVNNATKGIPQNNQNMGYIVSTKRNQNSFVYEGKQYINVTSSQRMIWLYKSE
jgi:energy-coupling factor transporter transmembrane protein EcfT